MDRPRVVIDVGTAGASCARDLAAGGVFVPGCAMELHDECELVVRTPGGDLALEARAVFIDARGTGLELLGFGPELKASLAALVDGAAPPVAPAAADTEVDADPTDVTPALEPAEPDPDATDVTSPRRRTGRDTAGEPLAKNIYERLRGLTLAEQIKAAHAPDPSARMALERMYGKTVWEPLLRNPRLTAPEVARISRMGALPRPLVELIVNNASWLQMPEVRRALLNNPRLGTDQILRVLRLLPKHELKVAASSTAYPYAVRDAAKRLLKDD